MVTIGGITRLTDSGLSMTEWSLISGMIPPITSNDWIEAFNKYKLSPEFIYKNYDMTLSEFKRIFFWEYFHRIWGRLIGITYSLPFLYFWVKNKLTFSEKIYFLSLLALGAFQAFMGWFMVRSGLTENPDVSHFRLSLHLLVAFIIYSLLLFYLWRKIILIRKIKNSSKFDSNRLSNLPIYISIILLLITIVTGAFVAGTKAGWAYNNFPLMGDNFLPPVLIEGDHNGILYLLNDIGFIQFFHRILASTTLLVIFFSCFYILKINSNKFINTLTKILLVGITLQYSLGIIILLFFVPISLGIVHQLGSLIIMSLLVLILAENISLGAETNSQSTFNLTKSSYQLKR